MKKVAIVLGSLLIVVVVGAYVYVSSVWDTKYDAPYPNILSVNDSTMIARGEYLATGPAHCIACHTPKEKAADIEAGAIIPFSGGWEFDLGGVVTLRAPNITPDPETGHIAGWSEDEFINRMKSGRVFKHSPMPWPLYARMDTTDLQAIYRYLMSLEPSHNPVAQIHFKAGEAPAEQ